MGISGHVISKEPLYRQVKALLLQRICDGEWGALDALPSEWDLAAELGVSQGTVRKALGALVDEGVLCRQQGKGSFVAPLEGDWGAAKLVSPGLFDEAPDPLSRELLGVARIAASDEVAEALALKRHAPLHKVRLLWRKGGEVVALDEVLLGAERFDALDMRMLRQRSGCLGEVLLQRFAVRVRPAGEQFRVQRLEREDAGLLGVEAGVSALSVLSLFAEASGARVLWRQRLCLTERLAYTQLP